jgi:hypothetical protein
MTKNRQKKRRIPTLRGIDPGQSAAARDHYSSRMDDKAQMLRRRIDLYRGYLREGLNADQARLYLDQLQRDEAELKAIMDKAIMDKDSAPQPQN